MSHLASWQTHIVAMLNINWARQIISPVKEGAMRKSLSFVHTPSSSHFLIRRHVWVATDGQPTDIKDSYHHSSLWEEKIGLGCKYTETKKYIHVSEIISMHHEWQEAGYVKFVTWGQSWLGFLSLMMWFLKRTALLHLEWSHWNSVDSASCLSRYAQSIKIANNIRDCKCLSNFSLTLLLPKSSMNTSVAWDVEVYLVMKM